MRKFLTREEIIANRNFGTKEIDIADFGTVCIRKWSGKDRSKFLSASIKADGDGVGVNYDGIFDNQSLVVALSLCDDHGKRLFADTDIDIIGDMDATAIQSIYEAALELNTVQTGAVEEAAKNSDAIQSQDSISGLLENSDTPVMNSLSE